MMTAAAVSPALAVGAQEQRRIARAALCFLLEHRSQGGRDRHGAALVPFIARSTLGGQRHQQARLRRSACRSAISSLANCESRAPVVAAASVITPSARS